MEAAAIPFPNPERTPPVTMTYLVADIITNGKSIGNGYCSQAKIFAFYQAYSIILSPPGNLPTSLKAVFFILSNPTQDSLF
jgi:hypothetical protein